MNPLKPIKFLLVDDLDVNLVALEALLKRDNLELLKANSGEEALELLLIHDVALALIDVQMPGMSGFELAEVMRGAERTRTVPIIFLTAGTVDRQRRIRGYETGAVDFLPKPIDADNLRNKAGAFYELACQRELLLESENRLRIANEELAQRNGELAAADRSKDEFLAMLAHELRNPLAPLRAATEVLYDPSTTPEERQRALQMLRRQIGNMSHMLDDLLDVARITERKIELQLQMVDLVQVITAAVEVARPECPPRDQNLILTVPDHEIWVLGDPTRLEQVFGNLLTNACKYSGEETEIRVAAELDPSDPGTAVITVADDGKGIPPELLPRVFELFVQGRRSLDRRVGGLGIGLTIVSQLVTLHGGTISAHSEGEGKGSRFEVRLPVRSPQVDQLPGVEVSDHTKRLRILVVDDNNDAADSLALLLSLRGHTTQAVYSGNDALQAAREFAPEVVLLDLGLPGMDGFEVARKIRKQEGPNPTYLIALTGYGSESDRLRAKEAGFDEHLVKPANLQVLQRMLDGARCPVPAPSELGTA
jgi:signal transduction histidine kinase